jgi:multidrug efflux pump subunit AcrB
VISTAYHGAAHIQLTFNDDINLNEAMNDVKDQVALIASMPKNADKIEVQKVDSQAFQPVASIILSGPNYDSLRRYAKTLENQLLIKGISKVGLEGINERIIAVEVSSDTLRHHQISLDSIANQVALQNNEGNAGNVGLNTSLHEIGSKIMDKTISALNRLPIITHQNNFLRLGEIAKLKNTYPRDKRLRSLLLSYT